MNFKKLIVSLLVGGMLANSASAVVGGVRAAELRNVNGNKEAWIALDDVNGNYAGMVRISVHKV